MSGSSDGFIAHGVFTNVGVLSKDDVLIAVGRPTLILIGR